MRLDRTLAQDQFSSNLAVSLALPDERGDFALAYGEAARHFPVIEGNSELKREIQGVVHSLLQGHGTPGCLFCLELGIREVGASKFVIAFKLQASCLPCRWGGMPADGCSRGKQARSGAWQPSHDCGGRETNQAFQLARSHSAGPGGLSYFP